MRAVVTSFLVGVMVVAALFEAGPRQAWACSCGHFPTNQQDALDRLDHTDVLVLGVVEEGWRRRDQPEARIRTERIYKGEVPGTFTVTSTNCNGTVADFRDGERWLIGLRYYEGVREWTTGGCSAGVIVPGPSQIGASVWAQALEDAGVPWTSPVDSGVDSGNEGQTRASLPIAALIAVSVATLTLAGVYVAQRRIRRGANSD